MHYTFVPMTKEYATRIVDTWKYTNEHAIYNYCNEAAHMLDPEAWGQGIFAVLNEERELVGELSIEFLDAEENFTEYPDFADNNLINQRALWIGFGMRPDLVGQGHGPGFVAACVDYAVAHHQYQGEYVRLGVAKFNQRAIKAYEKAGFQMFDSEMGSINGQPFECIYMRKKL